MWPIGSSRCSQNSSSKAFCSLPIKIGMLTLFIGALKKQEEKDNQYKLKKAMAIAIGLTKAANISKLIH